MKNPKLLRSYQETILLDAQDLDFDTTKNGLLCPACRGGRTKERTFSITRLQEGILYNCFRDSCTFRGFIPTIASSPIPDKNENKVEFKPKPLLCTETAIPVQYLQMFKEKYGLFEHDLTHTGDFTYCKEKDGIIMPVNTYYGYNLGNMLRYYNGTRPKVLAYREADSPWMAHYSAPSASSTVVLVEDQVSAVKVARISPCYALLGTTLPASKVAEIRQHYSSVILALDPDAKNTSIKHKKKYSLYFENFYVEFLSKDPKEISTQEIREIIQSAG